MNYLHNSEINSRILVHKTDPKTMNTQDFWSEHLNAL